MIGESVNPIFLYGYLISFSFFNEEESIPFCFFQAIEGFLYTRTGIYSVEFHKRIFFYHPSFHTTGGEWWGGIKVEGEGGCGFIVTGFIFGIVTKGFLSIFLEGKRSRIFLPYII